MTHYYLIDTSVVVPGAAVSSLLFNIIHEEAFIVHDLKVCMIRSSIYPSVSFFDIAENSVIAKGAQVARLS